jgi:putative membrane protein
VAKTRYGGVCLGSLLRDRDIPSAARTWGDRALTSFRPRAFRLSPAETAQAPSPNSPHSRKAAGISLDASLEALLEGGGEEALAPTSPAVAPRRKPFNFGAILVSALGGLALIAVSTGIEGYVVSLFAQNAWLGGLASALAFVSALALLGLIGRELATILRQRRILALQERAALMRQSRDVAGAAALVADLAALYARRPDTARARSLLAGLDRDVIDPQDRIAIAERELIAPLDAQAQRLVAASAQRVSIVTALAPRAVFDVLFVAGQSLWLIRRVAEIYGSRPGLIAFLALTKRVLSHLAITGGMAVGDSLVQQVLGHGIASRLSAKLGEGVLNGLLTARVGLAAIGACRPLPFAAVSAPKLRDVAGSLLQRSGKEETKS